VLDAPPAPPAPPAPSAVRADRARAMPAVVTRGDTLWVACCWNRARRWLTGLRCVCVCVCVCVLLLCAPRTPCRDMAAANLEVAVDCIFGAALSLNTLGQKEDSLGDRAAGIDVTRVGPAS
jgi:hypothetical protein